MDSGAGGRVAPPLRGLCIVAPELERVGGYELATLALARHLRSHAIRVSVVTTTTGAGDTLPLDGVTAIKVRGRHTLLAAFPRLLAFLVRRRSAFSVIYCPTFSHLSGLAILGAEIVKCPAIIRVATENDVREFWKARTRKGRLFFRLLRRAAAVIAPSTAICDELLQAGFPRGRVVIQPNAVDADRFLPVTPTERLDAKRRLGVPAGACTIGTVARLVPRKGIDVLLRAFASPAIQAHHARLLVVGDGPLAPDLEQLARELVIDGSVMWAGLQKDPRPWFHAMDVFAFPSRLEGSPNAVLEAMATGLPVVATRIGGIVDLIQHEETGLLVPPDDVEALALALERLLGDVSFRLALGSQARSHAVASFSLPTVVAQLTKLCLALQTHRPPP